MLTVKKKCLYRNSIIGNVGVYMMQGQPVIILKEGTERSKGKGAQSNNIAAAKAIADAVRSALGPKGMDKMLVDSMGEVTVTNDGVTILKQIEVDHPAAKMMIEVAKTQDDEVGDGTTSAVILAGDLLKHAEYLIEQNVHPTVIVNGYRLAAAEALKLLDKIAFRVKPEDDETLRNIAITAMTGKSLGREKDRLAKILVEATKAIREEREGRSSVDIDNILIQKKQGGSINDTELIKGVVLDKERVHPRMPKFIKGAKVALVNRALEIKKTEFSSEIQIKDPAKLQMFLKEEEKTLKGFVDKIKASGANVLICQKGIDDLSQHYLAKDGIYAVRRAKESDMKKLAKATGGKIVTNLDDLTSKQLGFANTVEERKIGDDEMTFVTGCRNPKSVSILIRGGTEHVVDELERILNDGLRAVACVLEDGQAVAGGGSPEIELSLRLKDRAASVGGREQLAMEAFAKAMEIVPRTLAENAGLDAIDTLIQLRSRHEGDRGRNVGINAYTGKSEDMKKLKIVEPLRVKVHAIKSATDAAAMVLRIDDVIASKATSSKELEKMAGGGQGYGGYGGGPGGGMMPGMM